MRTRTKIIIFSIIGILVLIVGGLLRFGVDNYKELLEVKEQNEAFEELVAIEKEELEKQYEDLAIQFDGFQKQEIRSDSLQDQLMREQQRVQDLLEELRQTKASNARKITELKNELATLRAVSQDLVRQIDSLNRTNALLTEENQQVKQENQQVKEENTLLAALNDQLTETVTRASMLEMTSISVVMLDKNDKKTSLVRKLQKLEFDFAIAKNITCEPGMKELYACLFDPAGNLLGEEENHLFTLDDKEIPYSFVQPFEYTGEAYKGACYYAFTEGAEIEKGTYTIYFFCDGNEIGKKEFELKK